MDQAVQDKKPFFLYMAHYAVHVPFAKDSRFYDKYKEAGLDDTEAMYSALVEGMDKSLGDIVDLLEKRGVTENTIILFMSDNGGLSVHGRGGQPMSLMPSGPHNQRSSGVNCRNTTDSTRHNQRLFKKGKRQSFG